MISIVCESMITKAPSWERGRRREGGGEGGEGGEGGAAEREEERERGRKRGEW
jgi:hypothetical protein